MTELQKEFPYTAGLKRQQQTQLHGSITTIQNSVPETRSLQQPYSTNSNVFASIHISPETQKFLEQKQPVGWNSQGNYKRQRNESESEADATCWGLHSVKHKKNHDISLKLETSCSNNQREDVALTNRSCSLLRGLYLERKTTAQIVLLLILLVLSAAVSIIFVFSAKLNGDEKTNLSNFMNQLDDLGYYNDGKINKEVTTFSTQSTHLSKSQLRARSWNNADSNLNLDSVENSKTVKKLENVKEVKNTYLKPILPVNTLLKIESVEDFKKLESTSAKVEAIEIVKLLDETKTYATGENETLQHCELKENLNVKYINFSGPITEYWMQCILSKFKNIIHLTINVDELCIGATVRNRDSLNPVRLENVSTFNLINSHLCTISSWLFRWQLPNVQNLLVHDMNLTKRTFDPFRMFLESRKNSLTSVTVSKSFMCLGCSLDDIKFDKMKNITYVDKTDSMHLSE